MSNRRLHRRDFLKVSGAAALVAAGRAPAFAQGTKLHIVRWVDFIPESDVELKRQMPEASKALGAEITLETINANDLQPRITAAIQSGSGADIFHMLYNWPQLYANSLVDVSDVAEAIAKAEGGFYDVWSPSAKVNGKWMAMPHAIVGNAVAYRRSWLREVGAAEFPKTWDEARKVFALLKKKGKPYGQTLGHTFGDAPTFTYPMLWAFGGAETDKTGKKVVINAKGAVDSVRFMQAFWKECCDEGGLAWDDTNNNRAFHAGEISATLNGASIYIVAKRQKDKIKDEKGEPMFQDIDHHDLPAGPAGAYTMYLNMSHGVMKYTKNPKLAKDFLKWLHAKEHYERWFVSQEGYSVGATRAWEKDPMWSKVDKPLQMFREAARNTRIFGYQGPATAKATEAFSKYIITDMYAKAVQGMKAEDAVKWAEGELKKIYEA
jgi:multiple sugar transport system substrate-binding protein